MADCEQTLRDLQAFLDHEITDATRTAIEGHLGGCTDCLQAFEFHAELRTAIARKLRNEALPEGLNDRLRGCFGDDLNG